jgi:predicted adenine nucleotide alpha hydrolase (AANH) superfamily ATPase
MKKPKLLLHTCCAPCSGFLAGELSKQFEVTIFFSNSNIWPQDEYLIRLEEAKRFFKSEGFEFLVDDYDHDNWLEAVKGLENEPERGERCAVCYRYRLKGVAKRASDEGFDIFGSTMSISPHKVFSLLSKIGNDLSREYDVGFLDKDFKKEDGFKRAMAYSKECGFYHQNYCGCEFSRRKK